MTAPRFTPDEVETMLSTLAGIDFKQVYADFKAGNAELMIGDALLIAQVGTKDAGYFFPVAATASQWIGLARAIMPVLVPTIKYADSHLPPPHQLQPNEVAVWGYHPFVVR